MLSNVPPQETPLRLETSKSFSFRMGFVNASGRPIDMTGAELHFTAVDGASTEVITLSAVIEDDPVNGVFRFDVQPADVNVPVVPLRYNITLRTAQNYIIDVMMGDLELVQSPSIVWADQTYADDGAVFTLNAIFGGGNRITVKTAGMPPPTLSAAPVQVLPAGSMPTARISGAYPYQILELGIPLAEEAANPEIILVEGDGLVPLGTESGTVVYRLPEPNETLKVSFFSSHTGGAISSQFELPDDVRIGDVLLATIAGRAAGSSVTWAAPWTEIIDLSQSQMISAAVYKIPDQAALDALVKPSVTPAANFNSGVLSIQKIRAITGAWPAYGSGNGRSAATLVSPTNAGFTINSIGTSPFVAYETNYAYGSAFSLTSGPAPEIETPAGFEEIVNASCGGLRFAMWKRFPAPAMPIPAVPVVVNHDPALANALYGGCQFVVPTA